MDRFTRHFKWLKAAEGFSPKALNLRVGSSEPNARLGEVSNIYSMFFESWGFVILFYVYVLKNAGTNLFNGGATCIRATS